MTHLDLDLFYDIYNIAQSKTNSLHLIAVSNPIWYLESSSPTTLSALSLNMISVWSLLEPITHSSSASLEEKSQLLLAVEIFMYRFLCTRSSMMSLKYGLFLWRYSSIDSVLFLSALL